MPNLTTEPPPQLSLDGRWRWDGTQWVPVKPSKRPDRIGPGAPQMSSDGRWWWNGYKWVPAKSASSPPPPPQDASTGPSAAGPGPKPRRRRWWIIAGIVIASVVGVGIAGFVLTGVMHSIDTYTADLTKGSGGFRTTDNASNARFYRADGYHMVAKTPGFVFAGEATDFSHTAIAAKVTVRAVTAPPGAAFGPFVLASQTGGGYWLSVDSAGTATLNEIDAKGNVWALTSAKAPPLSAGTTRTLMLTCVINGTVHLAGYVDGTQVITGPPATKISSVTATGMMGQAKTSAPAEWAASRFARLGPDDMPANTPGRA